VEKKTRAAMASWENCMIAVRLIVLSNEEIIEGTGG
jgi:hypothetical protein